MCRSGQTLAIRHGPQPGAFPRLLDLTTLPPALVKREPSQAAPRRTRLWEFNTNLHCSIIGTCLSAPELRHLLAKLKCTPGGATDHELHSLAVSLAGKHEEPARQIHKALDHRHRLAVNQFARATTEEALRALWAEAVKRAEIPGAYWATLTHPAANQAVIRMAFGEVHMLSHLVGSANRADLKRLVELEAEKTDLQSRLVRQQDAFRDAVVSRDAQIAALCQSLAQQIATAPRAVAAEPSDECATLHDLVADLEKRLSIENRRRIGAEEKLAAALDALAAERSARGHAERDAAALRQELDATEAACRGGDPTPSLRMTGKTVLYVGGRPNQTSHLRATAETLGATFLHHDGGIECHQSLLPGLVSRADLVVFPVDCVSHDAVLNLKALCRQGGKRFMPVRTASVTALLAALREAALARPRVAAE